MFTNVKLIHMAALWKACIFSFLSVKFVYNKNPPYTFYELLPVKEFRADELFLSTRLGKRSLSLKHRQPLHPALSPTSNNWHNTETEVRHTRSLPWKALLYIDFY